MERKNLKLLLYVIFIGLVLTALIIVMMNFFAPPPPPPSDPYDFSYDYSYDPFTAFLENVILVFVLLILLPGIVITIILKTTAKDVLRQIEEENNKVINNTRPEVLYGLLQIFQSPVTPMGEKMSLLKCVRCGHRGKLKAYKYIKSRSEGKYATRTMSIIVPMCSDCEMKINQFEKLKWVRYVAYCLTIVILFVVAFYSTNYTYNYYGSDQFPVSFLIPFVIIGAIIIEWLMLQHKNNRRKYMKFSYGTDTPKIKPEGKGVWINFNDWIKFALCETAAIEGSNIEQFIDFQQPSSPTTQNLSYSSLNPNRTSSYSPTPRQEVSLRQVFCTECGSKIEPGSKFCGECGHPIE